MMENGLRAGLLAALLFSSPAISNAADFPALFNTVEYRGESLDALPQWQRVLGEVEREKPRYQNCDNALTPCEPSALLAWQSMIKSQRDGEPLTQLQSVNRFVNRWQARTDQENYDKIDYWASPLTFLERSGDCEDYAILKYVSLRQLGFEAKQLRVVVVRDVLRDIAHAVLAVHVDDTIFILDNLFQAVLPQHLVSQYIPYYSVNETARFSHLPPNNILMASSPWNIMLSMGPASDDDMF